MFFSGRGDPSQPLGYGPIDGEVRGGPEENYITIFPVRKSMIQWAVVLVPNLFSLVSLLLNTLCFVVMVIKSQCTFTSALNLLIMAFLLSMAYYSLNNMVCSIFGEILFMQGKALLEINQLGDLFSSYFSVILLFLIGVNRDAVYTNPTLMKTLFKRKNMVILLPVLAILSLVVAFLIYSFGGMSRRMESDGLYADFATNVSLITICSYIAYGIALSSGIFYIRVFFHLRQQRVGVTHDKTKALLDKAERQNCAQATFIMGMYLVSLVAFIICDNIEVDESRQMILHSFEAVVKIIPALGIPTAMLLYCDKMQSVLKYILFDKRKGKKCRPSSTSTSSMATRRTTLSVVSTL